MAIIREGNKAVLLVVDVQVGVMRTSWDSPRIIAFEYSWHAANQRRRSVSKVRSEIATLTERLVQVLE